MKKTFKHSKFTATFTDEDGYFSFTGDVSGCSGAVSDKIAEIDPRFKLLDDMHLSNCETGAPMHAWANAEHFFKNGEEDALRRHLHVDDILFMKYVKAQMAIIMEIQNAIPNTEINITNLRLELEDVMDEIKDQWQEQAQEVYDLVDEIESNLVGEFVDPFADDDEFISDEYEDHLSGYDIEEQEKMVALAKHENIDVLEVEQCRYGDHCYTAAGREYLVVTDEEADEVAKKYIESSAWTFNASFLSSFTGMPIEMFEAVQDKCEGSNDAILQCIERSDGLDEFVEQAVSADGRGHFISHYDGHEREEEVNGTTYFIYRQ